MSSLPLWPRVRRVAYCCAALLVAVAGAPALAVPLTSNDTLREEPGSRALTNADVLGSGAPVLDTAPGVPEAKPLSLDSQSSNQLQIGVPAPGAPFQGLPQDGTGPGLADVFRPFVNLNPQAPGTGRAGGPARGRSQPDIVMFGTDVQEWMDEAVRGIVNSAIELRVDDKGRASFSVLGMGDFGVMVSGDRNELALVSGSDVLFTAQRNPQLPSTSAGYGSGAEYGGAGVAGSHRPIESQNESPLKQAMELAAEIVTHPLSLMIYLIVGAYALLWNVMSAQRPGRHAHAVEFARPSPSPGAAPRRRRRSHRVRHR